MWVYYKDHLFKKSVPFLCFSLRILVVSVKHQEKLIIVPTLPIREKKQRCNNSDGLAYEKNNESRIPPSLSAPPAFLMH